MYKLFCLLLLALLATCQVRAWKGFYTCEYPSYTVSEQVISVVFTLEAPPRIVKQAPLSLTTVLDTSGSMQGRGIELLKATTQFLIARLAESNGLHDVALVKYASAVDELTPLVPATVSNAEFLSFLVASIEASGKTFLSGGLELGLQQQLLAPYGKVKSVYLFSDGIPNVGLTSVADIVASVERLLAQTNEYMSISTFGMGNEIDYGLLSAIAQRGRGETYIITRPEDIPYAFGKALGGLATIVGTDIEVIFTTFPGCRIKSVKTGGVLTMDSFTVRYGNLYAGEVRDILFEVTLGVGSVGFEKCLQAEYYYVDAVTRERLKGGAFVLEVERKVELPVVYFPAPRVLETRLKYLTADACRVAKDLLLQGDSQGAQSALLSAKETVTTTNIVESAAVEALLSDIDTLVDEVVDESEDTVFRVGSVGTVMEALRNQRSVSTKKDASKSAELVETLEQREIKDTIVNAVLSGITTDEGDHVTSADGDSESVVVHEESRADLPTVSPSPSPDSLSSSFAHTATVVRSIDREEKEDDDSEDDSREASDGNDDLAAVRGESRADMPPVSPSPAPDRLSSSFSHTAARARSIGREEKEDDNSEEDGEANGDDDSEERGGVFTSRASVATHVSGVETATESHSDSFHASPAHSVDFEERREAARARLASATNATNDTVAETEHEGSELQEDDQQFPFFSPVSIITSPDHVPAHATDEHDSRGDD